MPSVVDGKMHYDLTPEQLAEHHHHHVSDLGIDVIGGCCGTTPAHLKAVVDRCADLEVPARTIEHEPGATSIYSLVPFHQDTSFLIIGERTNANGSKKFREAMLDADWDLVRADGQGPGQGRRPRARRVRRLRRPRRHRRHGRDRLSASAPSRACPWCSTPPSRRCSKPASNGSAVGPSSTRPTSRTARTPGSRLDRVFTLAREYGAAVICLLIDEEGQARDVEWKMRVAHRIHDLAVNRYGLEASDLIFDTLTFPLSTGDDDLRRDAMDTMEAIERIKAELPGVYTMLGLSNVSFGLKPAARHVLNSVFLHECVQAGLDSAIVHAARIMPLNKIPDEQRDVCLDLIYDRRRGRRPTGYDPLQTLLEVFADVKAAEVVKEDRSDWPVEKRLSQRIIDGERDGLIDELDEALAAGFTPLAIINDVLLAGHEGRRRAVRHAARCSCRSCCSRPRR